MRYLPVLGLWVLASCVAEFNPRDVDLKMGFLLANVPQEITTESSDLDLYDYITYSLMFKTNVDKYGYIIGMDQKRWDGWQKLLLNENDCANYKENYKQDTIDSTIAYIWHNWYHQWEALLRRYFITRRQLAKKFKFIAHVLNRSRSYNVVWIVFNKVDYLLLYDSALGYSTQDMVYYVNRFQLGNLNEQLECWVENIDYINKATIVRLGHSPWTC